MRIAMKKHIILNCSNINILEQYRKAEQQSQYASILSSESLSSMVSVPLDATSLAYALQLNLPHIIPSDVVNTRTTAQLPLYIAQKIKDWAEAVDYRRLGFSCNWILHDSVPLQFLLQSAYMAFNMIPFFKKNSHKLITPRRHSPEFLPNLCCSDTPQVVWEKHLNAITKSLPYQDRYPRFLPFDGWAQDFSSLQNSITFAYYEVGIHRSFGHIRQVIEKARDKSVICIMPCMYNPTISREIVSDGTITPCPPYLVAPLDNPTDPNPSYFSENTLGELVESAQKVFPELGIFELMLLQFINERYPYLERMYRGLRSLWSQYRPKLCVAENLAQGEYSIPLLVANELEIPSVSTPHSLFHLPAVAPTPATMHACASPLVKKAYEEKGCDCTAQAFDEVYCKISYPSSKEFVLSKSKNFSLLVLPADSMQHSTPLLYGASPHYIEQWLDALQRIPEKLKSSVELFYKLHPAFGAVELLKALNISEESIIPSQIPAEAIIESFDLVVCIEYVSSPNQIALEKNIPLINCIHDVTTFNRAQQHFIANTFTINDYDALWPAVVHKVINPFAKQNVLAQQSETLDTIMRAPKDVWVPTLESLAALQKR